MNDSSVHEIIPKPKYLSYSISKGGLENLTKTLALEYADRGIRVNAVGPGAIVTPMNKSWIDDPKARGEVESHIPMKRAGEPDEIAGVFAFLASSRSPLLSAAAPWVSARKTAGARQAAQTTPTINRAVAVSRQSLLPGADCGTDMTTSRLMFVQ